MPRTLLIVSLLALGLTAASAPAAIINVPADHATIQGAIVAAAVNGDEIIVAPGTYNELINFNGKTVYLHSASGNPADTIIDGTGLNESVVLCISGEGPGTILEGFTITGGATGHNDGFGTLSGAGMYNQGSNPTVINCLFRGNTVISNGGGGMFNNSSTPTITNCIFSGNSALWGGGMYNISGSNPMVTNCSFSGNTAINDGGGMLNQLSSHPTLTNCILWGDSLSEIVNFDAGSTTTISFSNVLGGIGVGSIDGGGNFDLDPFFIDADGADNIPGTPDDDLRLSNFSPCTDAGDNTAMGLFGITTDLEGNPRFYDDLGVADTGVGLAPIVDMGAYERQVDSVYTTISVPGDFATIQGAIDAALVIGYEIIVAPGTYPELINFNGKAVYLHSASGNPADTIIDGAGLGSVVKCESGEGPGTILEGFTITGGNTNIGGGMRNDGSSPTITNCSFSENTAVFLGGGMDNRNSSSPTITNCTFSGNSAGTGAGMYNNGSSPTITNCTFSGNTAGSGGGGMYNISGSNPTITNCTFSGNTAGSGGGMFNANMLNDLISYTISNCTFSGNSATNSGGGMYNAGSNGNNAADPIVLNCTFSGNTAGFGGGMYNVQLTPFILSCDFIGNSAQVSGGGMYNGQFTSTLVFNCNFSGNGAKVSGGGIYNVFDNAFGVRVRYCSFNGNTAGSGGGMRVGVTLPINCTFSGNTAILDGGGIYAANFHFSSSVLNCTFSGNTANGNGGGIFNTGIEQLSIINCIFRDDSPNEIFTFKDPNSVSPIISFSNVQGGLGAGSIDGGGNIDLDPLFIDANGADNIPGTPDDDLRLSDFSPCTDAGDNTATGLSGITTDRDDNPRFYDDLGVVDTGIGPAPIVDMGAYERQVDSALVCPADITPPGGNGVVNIDDLVAVLNGFGACSAPPNSCAADITPPGGNGVVNIDDLVAVLNAFGDCP